MKARVCILAIARSSLCVVLLAILQGCGYAHSQSHGGSHHLVEIRGFEFYPQTLEVVAGDTISWRNHDIVPHTVTALPESESGAWSTDELAATQSDEIVWQAGWEQDYYCRYHPAMRGRVIVRDR